LTDQFQSNAVSGGPTPAAGKPVPDEWRFDSARPLTQTIAAEATRGWSAGPGVTSVVAREGHLAGRTTAPVAFIVAHRRPAANESDLLHALEVRLRVSGGANLAVSIESDEKIDLNQIARDTRAEPWIWTSPLIAGGEFNTYLLRPQFVTPMAMIRHLLIQPTDEVGATFDIESVRLISRKEHLASIASGVSWQGLSGIFHETIVTRSPQVWRVTVDLPERPWLDLSLGAVEPGPVTFRVAVQERGTAEQVLLERTLTTAHRWEEVPLDLGAFARKRITVVFAVKAEAEGTLGFWGGPVVRSRAASATTRAGVSPEAASPQGVIIIWADTLRRDHLDVYGHRRATTPAIRRMAGEGTLFKNCLTQATWTKVSTPSLMTSLYPSSHGVKRIIDHVPAAATTIAEVYRDAGYATFSYASNDFTGQMTNLHQGFDEVHESESLPDRARNSKTSRMGIDRLLPWVEAHRDAPFFAFLSVLDPHDPYKPYPPYDTLWADPTKEKEHERQTDAARKFIEQPFLRRFGMPSREEMRKAGIDPERYVDYNRDWYDGSIRGLDAEVGRLLERLRMLGLAEKTIVVFTSDHGEEFLEHGRTFHGQSVYGELNQVPLVFWGPGTVPAGAVVNEPVETIDLMPTLLEMSGVKGPAEMQGQSLRPLLAAAQRGAGAPASSRDSQGRQQAAGGGWRARPAITEKWPDIGDQPPLDTESFAIVMEGWKLIHNPKRHGPMPEYELYDFEKDPLNQNDIAAAHPDVVARLAKALGGWRAKANAERLKPDAESMKGLSQEQLERLRSLGYIR
jgi:arylsulfatase A-like enzyme